MSAGGIAVRRGPGRLLESERIDKDSLSDLSEQQQLRLQQHAERRSKALALVTSLMKKTAETQQGVVKNMK